MNWKINSNLREAAEMGLEALEIWEKMQPNTSASAVRVPAIQALRHALHSTKFLPEEMDAYERGFIEGRQDQMRSTVERAVNAMAKREWVGLTDEEIIKCFDSAAFGQVEDDLIINKHVNIFRAIHSIEAKLKEKNT